MNFHPAADCLPLMSDTEFNELVESITTNGLDPSHPVYLFEGAILDGRNRYRAATKIGITPVYAQWQGDNPWQFVWKENASRRDLDAGTKAACYRVYKRGSDAFEAERQAAREAANRRRSDAMTGRPYAAKGESRVSRDTPPLSEAEKNRARKRDAIAAGVSEATMGRTHTLESTRPDLLVKVSKREIKLNEALRQKRNAEVQASLEALPTDKYRVIYADVPWSYGDQREEIGNGRFGPATDIYPCMSLADICAIDVKSIAQDDAVLFLWATSPLLPEALEVIKAWNFTYKASFVWDKVRHNFGHYNSVRHEFLLVGTRGSCLPEIKEQIASVQSIEKTGHSRKPAEFRNIIDRLYPSGPRVELFARGEIPKHWKRWGAEVNDQLEQN
jgi:N6-adenosine-specific RNA methylase IME4